MWKNYFTSCAGEHSWRTFLVAIRNKVNFFSHLIDSDVILLDAQEWLESNGERTNNKIRRTQKQLQILRIGADDTSCLAPPTTDCLENTTGGGGDKTYIKQQTNRQPRTYLIQVMGSSPCPPGQSGRSPPPTWPIWSLLSQVGGLKAQCSAPWAQPV